MRIVLLQPPIEDFYATPIRLQPIGIAYLKAAIKQHFPEVDVILKDFQQGYGRRTLALPEELRFLNPYYALQDQSPFSTFHHYYRFGASIEQVLSELQALNPDLVGISMLFTAYAPQALELARAVRETLDVPILIGGAHASVRAQELLALPFVDFVIMGEGERPMVELVRQWLTSRDFFKVPNLGFKDKHGRPVFTHRAENFDIDQLPFPDFSDLPAEHYRVGKKRMSFLVSSRSCPYKCAFCSVHQTFGHAFRLRSVQNIVNEIEQRLAEGIEIIDFEDDNLNFDRKRFERLCKAFIELRAKFMAMNGLSYFRLNESLIDLMWRAGFREMNLSLVSTNETLLKKLKRPHDLQRFEQLVKRAHSLGMRIVTYQILGLPGDTLESMLQTLKFLSAMPVRIGVSPFYVTPGMPLHRELALEQQADWVYGRLTSLGATDDAALRRSIFTLFILARMVNFLKELELPEREVHLQEILSNRHHWSGRRFWGLEILFRLLNQNTYFIFDGKELKPLPQFDVALGQAFWEHIAFIRRLDGGKILLRQARQNH